MHFITRRLTCTVFMGFMIRTGPARAEPPTLFPMQGISQHSSDKGKYFQYVNVPSKGGYNFGFNRGNSEHSISRHEQSRGGSFRSKVKWNDNKGSSGEQYWEYNHDDKGDDAWNKEQSYSGNGGMQWANLPKGMERYHFKGYQPSSSGGYHSSSSSGSYRYPSSSGLKMSEEVPPWMKDFVNSGHKNNWEEPNNLNPWAMYGQPMLGEHTLEMMNGGVGIYGGNYATSLVDAMPSYQAKDPYQNPGPSYETASLPYPGESPGKEVRDEMYHQISGTFPGSVPGSFKESHIGDGASGYDPPAFGSHMLSYEVADQGNGYQNDDGEERKREALPLEETSYGNSGQPEASLKTSGHLGAGSMTEAIFSHVQNKQNHSVSKEEQKVERELKQIAGGINKTETSRTGKVLYSV